MNIEDIKITIAIYRSLVLGSNIHNYNIESKETIEAITFRPDKEIALLQRLWKLAMIYSRYNLSARPPKLLPFRNEDPEDYLERCYQRHNK